MEEIELTGGSHILRIADAAVRARGGELCFGEPVREGERTIVPVASVSTLGGLGFGSARGGEPSDGGGGGGLFGARPIGFIEITNGEARFRRIVTAADAAQVLCAVAVAGAIFARARRQVVSKQP